MQFSTVAIIAAASVASAATVTKVESSSTLVTITSCAETVTDCPATKAHNATSSYHYNSTAAVTTYGGAGVKNAAFGVAALAAGALLAL